MTIDFGKDYSFKVNNGKVYVRIGDPDQTWNKAESIAQDLGGHLVTINDAQENQWIVDNFGASRLWIGLNDVAQEGNFEWSSGEDVTYTNWFNGEPNNAGGNEDFVEINFGGAGKWNDINGNHPRWGLAEIDLSSAPEITTNDGQDLRFEVMENTTFAIDIDSIDPDGDTEGNGLTYSISGGRDAAAFTVDQNTGELSFRNAPDFENPGDNNRDNIYDVQVKVSDSGGLTFPNLPDTAKFYNGHAYLAIGAPDLTWHQAQAQAQQLGGNLVTINDAAENHWITEAFSGEKRFWTGLNDEAQEGNFEWVSGEDVTYTNWFNGEPNNAGNEDFVEINFGAAGKWNDLGGNHARWAIVEIDPIETTPLMDTINAWITVTDKPDTNNAPDAVNDSSTIDQGQMATIDVLDNDSDLDGDDLTIIDVENPANGTAEIIDGQVKYIQSMKLFLIIMHQTQSMTAVQLIKDRWQPLMS